MSMIKLVSLKAVSRMMGYSRGELKKLCDKHDVFVRPIKYYKYAEQDEIFEVEFVPVEAVEYLSKLVELVDMKGVSMEKARILLREDTRRLRELANYGRRI